MEKDKTSKAVRNVLMNELGLTREAVFEELRRVVENVIELNIDMITQMAIKKLFSQGSGWRTSLSEEAKSAIFSAMKTTIEREFIVDISPKDKTGKRIPASGF